MIGDIIFVKTSSPLSWLIRKLTNSEYSHVCVSVSVDNTYIIEADVFQRTKIVPNRYTQTKSVSIPMTDEQRIKLLVYLITYSNYGYDYMQILGFFTRLMGWSKKSNLWNSKNKLVCSELIDQGYLKIGIDLVPNRVDGDVMPSDLANILLGREDICCK